MTIPSQRTKDLQATRELIADEARWTRWNFACTDTGNPVGPISKGAVKWCLYGAIQKVTYEDFRASRRTDECVSFMLGFCTAPANDRHGHAFVLEKLDAAIAQSIMEDVEANHVSSNSTVPPV